VRKTLYVTLEVDLGDGLTLRPLLDADAEQLFSVIEANRTHLANWMPFVGQTRGVADSLAFIRAARRQFDENRGMQLALVEGHRIIGVVGFHAIDWARKSTSIGYWLAADRQGAGTMTRAVCALLDHAFGEWRLNRVEIRAGVLNTRSRAIPERLGFREEGVLPSAERIGARVIDHAIYVMTAREWKRHGPERRRQAGLASEHHGLGSDSALGRSE
jgi:ribosomal-protein-serine acetyltransferase